MDIPRNALFQKCGIHDLLTTTTFDTFWGSRYIVQQAICFQITYRVLNSYRITLSCRNTSAGNIVVVGGWALMT